MTKLWQGITATPSIGWRLRNMVVAATILSLMPIGASHAGTVMTSRTAVAEEGQPGDMCVMALAQQGQLSVGSLTFSGTPIVCGAKDPNSNSQCYNYSGTPCDIYNNSQATDSTDVTGNAEVAAAHYFLAGGMGQNSGTMIGTIDQYVNPTPDPYADLPQPSGSWPGSCNTPIDEQTGSAVGSLGTGLTVGQGVTVVLDAADYGNNNTMWICGNVTIDSQGILILKPGTYVIAPGTSNSDPGNLTVNGGGALYSCASNNSANPRSYPQGATCSQTEGSTIILTSGTVNISGSGGTPVSVNVTAPYSGPYTGVAFWVQSSSASATDDFTGGTGQVINGAIYVPNEQVVYNGGANGFTNCSQLVALNVEFSGNPVFSHNCPSGYVRDPKGQPRLVK